MVALDGPTGINGGRSPTPEAGKPIAGLLLIQVVPIGTTIGAVKTPAHTFTSFKIPAPQGMLKGTVSGYIPHPSVVKTVFPLIIVKEIGTPQGNPM